MEDRSPSSSTTQKQAACLNCRRSKTKCLRDTGASKCKKCSQTGAECNIPEYRVGRKKGIKNKREGLEKAVHHIEQALKRSKTTETHSEGKSTQHLRTLLDEAQDLLPKGSPTNANNGIGERPTPSQLPDCPPNSFRQLIMDEQAESPEDHFSVDDAENPLQLLARASDLSAPSHPTSTSIHTATSYNPASSGDRKLRAFFGPFRPSLDIGVDIDPIDLGLVTKEEATILFAFFYDNLSHTRWGLDPLLHTPAFVRKQSAFLFTSIMAGSALFMPLTGAVSRRLSNHCKHLAQNVVAKRHRSPEIVLAFMVNIPWMAPGDHWSDDGTCSYMALALTIAMDISLNKLVVPSPSDSLAGINDGKAQSDCITAKKALELDGFPDVEPNSDLAKRLLRRRERIWLALFVLDRGVCLARGRSFTVPLTALIERCDGWHHSAIADVWDGSIVSSAVLRRNLATLITQVKQACDSSGTQASGNSIAQSLQHLIDGFFNSWYTTWAFAIGGMKDTSIPPYVEILVTHGRLSIYSSVINHPTAPVEVKRFFRAAGLSSALNVLRAAVQGESRLKSMPNNTSIMISFAACFAFYLSKTGVNGSMSLAPSIRRLIEESADVLERLGSTPPHRNGASALYGRHLRDVIWIVPPNRLETTLPTGTYELHNVQSSNGTYEASRNFNFASMSDDQINVAINNAGNEFEMYLPDFQMEGQTGLDWLDWFNMDISMNE